MADTVKRVQYFYIEASNKPGEGAKVLTMLQEAGVDLLAFSGFPKGRRAQIDIIPANDTALRAVARRAKVKLVGPKSAFLIQGNDRIGAIANHMTTLADVGINVTAIDAVVAGAGRYGAILWVKPRDVNKAAKTLGAS